MSTYLLFKTIVDDDGGLEFLFGEEETNKPKKESYLLIGTLTEKIIRNWYALGLIDGNDKIKYHLKDEYESVEVLGDMKRVDVEVHRVPLQEQIKLLEKLQCPLNYLHLDAKVVNDLIKLWSKIKELEKDKGVVNALNIYELEAYRSREIVQTEEHEKWLKKNKIKIDLSLEEVERRISGNATVKQLENLIALGFTGGDLSKDEADLILSKYKEMLPEEYKTVTNESDTVYWDEKGDIGEVVNDDVKRGLVICLVLNNVLIGLGSIIRRGFKGNNSYIINTWICILVNLAALWFIPTFIANPTTQLLISTVTNIALTICYMIFVTQMQVELVTSEMGLRFTKKRVIGAFLSMIAPGLGIIVYGGPANRSAGIWYLIGFIVGVPLLGIALFLVISIVVGITSIVTFVTIGTSGLFALLFVILVAYYYNLILAKTVILSE